MIKKDLVGNPEFEALKDIEGVNPEDITRQAMGEPPVIKADGGDLSFAGTNPPVPTSDPAPPVAKNTDPAPDPRSALMNEIFGERFKTVEDAKNVVSQLEELESLRQAKTDLENRLANKPKTNFANDEVALFNEFVKETGVANYPLFAEINASDIANMNPLDAVVMKQILANPQLSGKRDQVRKHFEKKWNIDPDNPDDEDADIVSLTDEGTKAKQYLVDLKTKLKVPEQSLEIPTQPKELTPEERESLHNRWTPVADVITKNLSALSIPIKNAKDPLLTYALTDQEKAQIKDFVAAYAVENRMELNEQNTTLIGTMLYNQLMLNKFPDIVHSVFEKARKMTEKEVSAMYENPSPVRNNDQAPVPTTVGTTDEDAVSQKIFDAEMGGNKF